LSDESLEDTLRWHSLYLKRMQGGVKADLTFGDHKNADLKGADLTGAKMTGVKLDGSDLSGAKLVQCDMFGAELTGANLRGADLSRSDLRGADLQGADLTQAKLTEANLGEGTLLLGPALTGAGIERSPSSIESKSDLSGSVLRDADLFRANLAGALLKDADLRGANLRDAVLSGADLSRALVAGAKFDGADLSGANTLGVDFESAALGDADVSATVQVDKGAALAQNLNDELEQHQKWLMSGGESGRRADFSERDLSGVDFTGKILIAALFDRAALRGARFCGCAMALSSLESADATGADFTKADLRGANLMKARMRRAILRNADLLPEQVTKPDGRVIQRAVQASGADFRESVLSEARMDGLIHAEADFSDATLDDTQRQQLGLPR
jgi:uncharacterized protein YjbI with pentapeptide repeats